MKLDQPHLIRSRAMVDQNWAAITECLADSQARSMLTAMSAVFTRMKAPSAGDTIRRYLELSPGDASEELLIDVGGLALNEALLCGIEPEAERSKLINAAVWYTRTVPRDDLRHLVDGVRDIIEHGFQRFGLLSDRDLELLAYYFCVGVAEGVRRYKDADNCVGV